MRRLVWFSCGAASAVAAKLAVDRYGAACEVVYCDTMATEHPDNARFFADVERWIGRPITRIKSERYSTIDDVFERRRYMSGIGGAICTTEMKKLPREAFQSPDDIHIFGYTSDERERADSFEERNPSLAVEWLLIDQGVSRCRRARRRNRLRAGLSDVAVRPDGAHPAATRERGEPRMSGRDELKEKVARLIHQRSGHVENHQRWGGCHDAAAEVIGMLPPDLVTARVALEELQQRYELTEAGWRAQNDELREALRAACDEVESWIHDQLDGTGALSRALKVTEPWRALIARHPQEKETDRG